MSYETFRTPEGVEVGYASRTLILRKIRRWSYRGQAHAECWLEGPDGAEECWGDTPLGLDGREGHVYCVVSAFIKGRATALNVGAINLTTQRYKLLGGEDASVLNRFIPDRTFGRWWFMLAAVASVSAAFNWANALAMMPWLQPWHAVAFPFVAAVVGFLASVFSKPTADPSKSFNDAVKQILFSQSAEPVDSQPSRRRRRNKGDRT